jgi:hypothetical protein
MPLSYQQFVEKSIAYENYANHLNSSNPTNNATEESVMQIPKYLHRDYIKNGFNPQQTPYEMFCQNEQLYLQILTNSTIDFDYGFRFDFAVAKQLPPNIQKCIVELYCYINPSTVLQQTNDNYLPIACCDHFYKSLQTFDEHIALVKALSQMNQKTTVVTHPQIIDAVGENMFNEVKQYLQPIVDAEFAKKTQTINEIHETISRKVNEFHNQSIDEMRETIATQYAKANEFKKQIDNIQNEHNRIIARVTQKQLELCRQRLPELFEDYDIATNLCKQQLEKRMSEIRQSASQFIKDSFVVQNTIQPDIEKHAQRFGIASSSSSTI